MNRATPDPKDGFRLDPRYEHLRVTHQGSKDDWIKQPDGSYRSKTTTPKARGDT